MVPVVLVVLLAQTPAPAPPSRGFRAALIAHATAQAADLSTTEFALGTGRYREANPVLRPLAGGPIRMALVKSALAVTTSGLLLRLHRTHPKLAVSLTCAATAFAVGVAAKNARLVRPARTP